MDSWKAFQLANVIPQVVLFMALYFKWNNTV